MLRAFFTIGDHKKEFVNVFLFAVAAFVSLAQLVWLLVYSSYGFDFTDEGFYLNAIRNPFIYPAGFSLFGFFWHPVYWLLDGDIVRLRQINFLFLFSLSFGLAFVFLKTIGTSVENNCLRLQRLCLSLALSSSSFMIYQYWLPAPSYNSLALEGLLISTTALLLIDRTISLQSLSGWVLLAIGGWATFMAKPTSAALLGLTAFLYLIVTRKIRVRGFMLAGAMALILVVPTALYADGSVQGFIDRLLLSLKDEKLFGAGHTVGEIFRLGLPHFRDGDGYVLVALTIIVFLWLRAATSISAMGRKFYVAFAILFLSINLSILLGFYHPAIKTGLIGILIAGIPLAGFLAMQKRFNRDQLALAVLLIVLPYIFAFGTDNDYWDYFALAAIFWVAAGCIPLIRAAGEQNYYLRLLPLAITAQTVTLILLAMQIAAPYRQAQALWLNDTIIYVSSGTTPLKVSKEAARYIHNLREQAALIGFKPDMPVIDMTGHYPGSLYLLQAKAIPFPWVVGGYKGSDQYLDIALGRLPCDELSKAWILSEPDGPLKLSDRTLQSHGLDLAQDYTKSPPFLSPLGQYDTHFDHYLLKPMGIDGDALYACQPKGT